MPKFRNRWPKRYVRLGQGASDADIASKLNLTRTQGPKLYSPAAQKLVQVIPLRLFDHIDGVRTQARSVASQASVG